MVDFVFYLCSAFRTYTNSDFFFILGGLCLPKSPSLGQGRTFLISLKIYQIPFACINFACQRNGGVHAVLPINNRKRILSQNIKGDVHFLRNKAYTSYEI